MHVFRQVRHVPAVEFEAAGGGLQQRGGDFGKLGRAAVDRADYGDLFAEADIRGRPLDQLRAGLVDDLKVDDVEALFSGAGLRRPASCDFSSSR